MFDQEKIGSAPKGTSWRLTVTNEQTGEAIIDHKNVGGGIFVVSRLDDKTAPTGTDQGCFGAGPSIAICAAKTPPLMREMLRKIGQYDLLKEMVALFGLDTSIV